MTVFENWLDTFGGVAKLAETLDIDRRTIYFWMKRQHWPKTAHVLAIRKLSAGKLTADDILDSVGPELNAAPKRRPRK